MLKLNPTALWKRVVFIHMRKFWTQQGKFLGMKIYEIDLQNRFLLSHFFSIKVKLVVCICIAFLFLSKGSNGTWTVIENSHLMVIAWLVLMLILRNIGESKSLIERECNCKLMRLLHLLVFSVDIAFWLGCTLDLSLLIHIVAEREKVYYCNLRVKYQFD